MHYMETNTQEVSPNTHRAILQMGFSRDQALNVERLLAMLPVDLRGTALLLMAVGNGEGAGAANARGLVAQVVTEVMG